MPLSDLTGSLFAGINHNRSNPGKGAEKGGGAYEALDFVGNAVAVVMALRVAAAIPMTVYYPQEENS